MIPFCIKYGDWLHKTYIRPFIINVNNVFPYSPSCSIQYSRECDVLSECAIDYIFYFISIFPSKTMMCLMCDMMLMCKESNHCEVVVANH